MLCSLYIKNFAIIEELSLEFHRGLTIITGETGAGKSILLGALGFLLGERASAELVRKGAEKAVVEASFDCTHCPRCLTFLKEQDLEREGDTIIRREVSQKGQSRCFINDTPVTLSVLSEFGDIMVDLHGQHDHQSLLKVDHHLGMLDLYAGIETQLSDFRTVYKRLFAVKADIKRLTEQEETLKQKQRLYEFQLSEIDSVNPEAGEVEELQNEERILENAERLSSETAEVYEVLYGAEDAVYSRLVRVRHLLQELTRIDPSFSEYQNDFNSAVSILSEVASFVQRYSSRVEFNSDRLSEVQSRLSALSQLKKKYGGSMNAVIELREKLRAELDLASNFDDEMARLKGILQKEQAALSQNALRLSEVRQEAALRLSKEVERELKKLGITNGRFEVRFTLKETEDGDVHVDSRRYVANESGIDGVEFFISTNLGEDLKPLAKYASGGEISRVMLSLKTAFASSEQIPVLIFDEIDTGISGKVAQSVGFSMKELAKRHQILAITHLPQIAAMADEHFFVHKRETLDQRTVTAVEVLNKDAHIREVAKLISGHEVTASSLQSAKELIEAGSAK